MSGTRAEPAAARTAGAGTTRVGRIAGTRPGRVARDWLAAHGLLWLLLAARQPPRRRPTVVERLWGLVGLPGVGAHRLVTSRSDVCIDGFPRSANTYALAAFRSWNRGLRVANHIHSPFQVQRAVALGVPCCVLVRDPLRAVASTVLLDRERISDDACYRAYIHYHRRVAPLRERLAVCRFEEVIANPAVVVERLNERFGTSFAWEPPTAAAEAARLGKLRRAQRAPSAAVPDYFSPVANQSKEERKAELLGRLASNPLLEEAESAYAEVVPAAEAADQRRPGDAAVVQADDRRSEQRDLRAG